jgi:D-glycero-D-manno-heptose 1,7-bisphosphate phosphatase
VKCDCRKPGTYFLREAEKRYALNMSSSWIIGDRDSDIICGKNAGVRTIRIRHQEDLSDVSSKPDFQVANLAEAVTIVTGKIN